jgi:hypothetical protein
MVCEVLTRRLIESVIDYQVEAPAIRTYALGFAMKTGSDSNPDIEG